MSEIILHNYPQSPVAERARAALGIKGLSWRWVEIPRLPPKDDLTALTGGYRRTPVMQIGADIYCDSHCMLRELERRFPEPSFLPAGVKGTTEDIAAICAEKRATQVLITIADAPGRAIRHIHERCAEHGL